ncbi:MAG TPA: TonB-dependent receptor [Sphingomicrobium sp.]
MRTTSRAMLSCSCALLALVAAPVAAQDTNSAGTAADPEQAGAVDPTAIKPQVAEAQTDDGEIIVTARRREESIVDVPLAITVVTSQQLEKLDITSTTELANYTPGLQFSDFTPGDSRNDRGRARPLIFRGINVGGGGSVTAAGGMFLDGAAVVGNEVPAGMDIGAVEVLRGPQSVYFGRSTMTGAVSYRTKRIPDDWAAEAELSLAQRGMQRFEASVAGPLIANLVKVRVTGLTEKTEGFVTNDYDPDNDDKLGARSRDSISGTIDITPTDAIEIKAYANYFQDEDGPAATAFIPAQFANCLRPGATRRTFCGRIPNRRNTIDYLNTDIPDNSADVIFDSPLLEDTGFDRQVGLQRQVFNSHLVMNWDVSNYLKLQSVSGYHTNVALSSADGIGQEVQPDFPYSAYFYSLTNKTNDLSTELRLSSDPERAFSWTVGANYVDAYDKVQAYVTFQNQLNGVDTNFQAFPQQLGTNAAKTYGVFGGAYLKLLQDRMTVSAEGRYQIDKRRQRQQNGTTFAETIALKDEFKSFNPRVSLDYDVGGDRKVYASYATGTRPGGFNTLLLTYFNRNDPELDRQLEEFLGVTDTIFEEEKLKIFELGFKGRFAAGRGYFDLNAYKGKLVNQQVGQGALIPLLGFTVTATTNVGETKVHGVEWQGSYDFTDDLSLATTFAWNHAERSQFINQGGLITFGTTDLSGVESANAPEYSGSAVLSYEREIGGGWDFFSNSAYVYRGKQWTDAANLSFIRGRHQVDLRAGAANEQFTFEAFMLNALNDRSYTSGNVAPDFGQPERAALGTNTAATSRQYSGFFGAIAPPRQVGLRFRAKI